MANPPRATTSYSKEPDNSQAWPTPPVTICVLTYGDYEVLAKRCIESIRWTTPRTHYRMVVGANAVGPDTLEYLEWLCRHEWIDELVVSDTNVNKCRMMRHLLKRVSTEFIWWFDDDSFITEPHALERWLELARASPKETVLWGHEFFFNSDADFSLGADVRSFVKSATWYRKKEPPSKETGDARWFFIVGGCWLVRAATVQTLDWPDDRLIKRNDDVFLCEAIRQQGWESQNIESLGVAINKAPRRGVGEDKATMELQMRGTTLRDEPSQ